MVLACRRGCGLRGCVRGCVYGCVHGCDCVHGGCGYGRDRLAALRLASSGAAAALAFESCCGGGVLLFLRTKKPFHLSLTFFKFCTYSQWFMKREYITNNRINVGDLIGT